MLAENVQSFCESSEINHERLTGAESQLPALIFVATIIREDRV
jgi:hypothetical protein